MFPIGDDDSAQRSMPVVTYAFIVLNVLFFFVELSGGEPFIERWSVVPRRLTCKSRWRLHNRLHLDVYARRLAAPGR